MENFKVKREEEDNDKKAVLMSLTVHVLLVALFFIPMGHALKSIENTQIQVELPKDLLGGGPALGLKNEGSGSNPAPGKPDPNAGNSKPLPPPTPAAAMPTPKPVPAAPKPVFTKPAAPATPPRKVETTEDPNAAVVRRQAEQARQRAEEKKYEAEAAIRAKRQADDAAKAAQADANRRQAEAAAAETAAAAAARKKFDEKRKSNGSNGNGNSNGNNGGAGNGQGQGNTGKPGNQGAPDGDPNSKVLTGIGRGPGTVNGFGGRGVRDAPRLQENSQKEGKIVLTVCVDADGTVTSVDYKAAGSLSNDFELIDAAKRNARQYRFAASSVDKQCGTITYNFIVK